ncbi:MAG: glycosyltransferase [Burkholderiaceae bacterium]|nr:glycosyltransferase [Rhodoferax sp.]MCP5272949.1 glycosyltransferase [Burkholderiaceae bacterium]
MRVLQLSKFYPPDHGGIEAVARDLSAGLVRAGVQVEVLCASKRRQRVDEVDALGVRVVRAGSYGLWLSTSMAPGLVRELMRRRAEPDIVHVHMPDPLAALAVWTARPRGRVVLHWHSDVVRQRFARHVYAPLERWLLDRADAVIATSPPYAQSSPALRRVAHKVAVIPIGAPPPVSPSARRLERIRQRHAGRRIVFALGRMTYYKGWDVLVAAARHLPEDVVVVVGGGGPELPQYRALAERAGLAERVRFVGPLSADSVEAYFRLADVFCMASTVRAEAYGVAVLEAMARGLPVVATDIPGSGLGWLHQDGVTGLRVPPGDADALARAIGSLLDAPELRTRFGQAGRARWAAHFTAETMADQTLALYRRLLAQPAGTAALSPSPD